VEDAEGLHIDDVAGICVDVEDDPLFDKYVASVNETHPARQLRERRSVELRSILVVDHESAIREGGLPAAIRIALHELAHAARTDLARGFYPLASRMVEIDKYLQERFLATKGQPENRRMPRPKHLLLEDVRSIVDLAISFDDRPGKKGIFGEWAVGSTQFDTGHDLLFYLLLYLLEREAADSGVFQIPGVLVQSVYVPPGIEPVE
jgi:hypothetical protein